MEFTFYDRFTYHPNSGLGELSIGQWLGVSHKVREAMSYWILPVSIIVILCTTVQRLMLSDMATYEWKSRMSEYDTKIAESIDVNNSDLTKQAQGIDRWNKLSTPDKDPEFLEEFNTVISESSIPDGPDDNMSDYK